MNIDVLAPEVQTAWCKGRMNVCLKNGGVGMQGKEAEMLRPSLPIAVQGTVRVVSQAALSRRRCLRSFRAGVHLHLERNGAQQKRGG